jgi:hypothetical protein
MSAVLAVHSSRRISPSVLAGGIKATLRIVQEKGLATTGWANPSEITD